MNLLIQKYLIILVSILILFGCAVTPEMTRKTGARDTQIISAKRSAVASCISRRLNTLFSGSIWGYRVIEDGESSVQLESGGVTMCVYDLEEWSGGTMVTLYEPSSFGIEETLSITDHCRNKLLESKK